MKINNVNTNFSGRLYLKHPEKWTRNIKRAILTNESIKEKLLDYDIIGEIHTKIEKKQPPYYVFHRQGDPIFKIKLTVQDENPTFLEKLKGLFGKKKQYKINPRRYHSERTTVERIQKLKVR